MRKVRPDDLIFPIIRDVETSIYKRFIARHSAADILNSNSRTFQFNGWDGALKKSYGMVNARKEQLAHWILRNVGYVCCPYDLMKLIGTQDENI